MDELRRRAGSITRALVSAFASKRVFALVLGTIAAAVGCLGVLAASAGAGGAREGYVSEGAKRAALPFVQSDKPIVERRGLKGPQSALPAPQGQLVQDKTTADSRTYASPDGAYVTRIYSQPVNYRDAAGKWRPIDNALHASGSTVHNGANSFSLSLPTQLGSSPVSVSAAGAAVSFSPLGAKGAGAVSGSAERFQGAYPGASLTYATEPSGVKEAITIASASAPTRYVYSLDTRGGLTAHQAQDGGINFTDASGRVHFYIPPAFMYDAEKVPAKQSVDLTLQRTKSGEQLVLSADRAWVAAHLAHGPVVIDPAINEAPSPDCWLSSSSPLTSLCGGTRLDVGQSGSTQSNSLLQFNTSSIPQDAVVLNAQVGLYLYGETTSNQQSVGLYRATSTWTSGADWNTKDGSVNWNSYGGDYSTANGVVNSSTGGSTGWNYWYPTKMVADWVSGAQPNDGMLLTDTAGTSATNDMSFYSHNYSNCNYVPFLQVEYDPRAGFGPGYQFDTQQLNDRTSMRVNVANGNMLLDSKDLNVTGTNGFDETLDRYYNSLWDSTYEGETGHGSTFSQGLDVWLHTFGNGDVGLYPGDGSAYLYVKNSDGTYQTPNGANADLTSGGGNYTLKWRRSGETWTFPTGTYSQASKIQNRQGNTISETYSSDGIDKVTDTQGRALTFNHQSSPAPGQSWSFVSGLQDSSGRTATYTYESSPSYLLQSYKDLAGNTTSYGWDSNNHLNQITTPGGNVTNITYDSQARVTQIVRTTNSAHTTGPTTTFTYGMGGGVGSPCSSSQKQTIVTDPDYTGSMPPSPKTAHTTTYCATMQDVVQAVYDGAGNERQTNYNANGDLYYYQTPGNSTASLGYDSTTNNLTSVQTGGSSGPKTTLGYGTDQPYLPNQIQDPQSKGTNLAYNDNSGNANTGSPPDGTLKSETSGSITASFGYHNADGTVNQGVPTSSTDANNHTTTYTPSGGNITGTAPPSGSGLGNESVTYDTLSRPCAIEDGVGQIVHYTYDKLDRVIQADSYYNGSINASTCAVTSSGGFFDTVKWAYDNDGNLTSMTDDYGATSYGYDALNRITSQTPAGQSTESYGYDSAGNLTSLQDGGGTVSYSYNGINELSSLTDPSSSTATTFTYDSDGQRTSINYPNGASVVYAYLGDNTGRLKSVTDKDHSGNTLKSYTYSYTTSTSNPACPATGASNVSLRQSVTDQSGNVTWYCYDQLNRLTEAQTRNSGGTQTADYKYGYDGNGNITSKTINGSTTNYAYNSGNQDSDTGWSYDQDGNEQGAPSGLSLNNDPWNQTWTINSTSEGFYGVDQTLPVWSGSNVDTETSILGLSARSNDSWTTHNNFTRDNQGALIDERTTSGNYYYMFDGLGSVVGLTNSSGNQANSYSYDPYGNTTSSSGSAPNYFSFAGGYNADGGLIKFGQRYYDPNYGRWTQRDSVNNQKDLKQADRYTYAGDDPVNAADPAGTDFIDINGSVTIPGTSIGFDGGVKIGSGGVHPYAGVGGGTSGMSASATYSSGRIKTGWSTTGSGCVAPEGEAASCLSYDSKTGFGAGGGVGTSAGIYHNYTW